MSIILRRHAEPRRGVAIDHERRLQSLVLLVGIDVGQLRQVAQRGADLRLPRTQLREVVPLQRELVLRVGLAPADPDILHRLQEQVGAGLLGELAAQPRDHLVGGFLALGDRLQRDEHHPGIALRAAREADDVFDGGIRAHDAS